MLEVPLQLRITRVDLSQVDTPVSWWWYISVNFEKTTSPSQENWCDKIDLFWPWPSRRCPEHVLGCSLLARKQYRGTSLIRNQASLGPYSRTVPRALW